MKTLIYILIIYGLINWTVACIVYGIDVERCSKTIIKVKDFAICLLAGTVLAIWVACDVISERFTKWFKKKGVRNGK